MEEQITKSFESTTIRTAWNEQEEEWYFSVVDVVGVLTEQETPRSASTYWAVLKKGFQKKVQMNCLQIVSS